MNILSDYGQFFKKYISISFFLQKKNLTNWLEGQCRFRIYIFFLKIVFLLEDL